MEGSFCNQLHPKVGVLLVQLCRIHFKYLNTQIVLSIIVSDMWMRPHVLFDTCANGKTPRAHAKPPNQANFVQKSKFVAHRKICRFVL